MIRITVVVTTDSSGPCSQVGRTAPVPAINARGLRKTFGSLVAADDLDLIIRPGEVVTFLGPNDAGKSTTLDMVLGLILPDVGTIELLGTSPNHTVQTGCVGVIFQDDGLLDDSIVGEILWAVASMGPRYCDSIPHASRSDDVVDQADPGKLLTRKASRCSGGERQCLCLALTLLPDPDLLVMDESIASMDVSARTAFWETMRTQTRHGRTVLPATHYLEEAVSFADCIVTIVHGRLVADGSVDEIRALGEGALVAATWPGLSEESPGRRLTDCPMAGSTGHAVARGEHVEPRATDSDTVARWLLSATPTEHLGTGAASLSEVSTALTPDGPDEIVLQRPEPRPST